jgi:hypothetical protein
MYNYENYLPWALNTHGPEKLQPGLNPCLYPTAGAQKENLFTPKYYTVSKHFLFGHKC